MNIKKVFIATLVVISLVCCCSGSLFAADYNMYANDESVNINVYEMVSPAVVTVNADIKEGASSGTGIIIDSDGIILTSSHVVGSSQDVTIILPSGRRLEGKTIAVTGENDDLALINVDSPEALSCAKLGDSTQIKVGQKVLAIGNPFGFERTLTTGIISRIDYQRHKIQTDAAINPGCSGGPLLNRRGEVIGINQSIYNPDNSRSNIGISFAVPINAAKRFIKNIATGVHEAPEVENTASKGSYYKKVGVNTVLLQH